MLNVQPKKALSTIRAVLNDVLDEHVVVVVWMVSGMKELLYFPKLPVPMHQSVCTGLPILPFKDALRHTCDVLSRCDLPRI